MEKDIAEDIKRIAENANTAEFSIFMRCLENAFKKSDSDLMRKIIKNAVEIRNVKQSEYFRVGSSKDGTRLSV